LFERQNSQSEGKFGLKKNCEVHQLFLKLPIEGFISIVVRLGKFEFFVFERTSKFLTEVEVEKNLGSPLKFRNPLIVSTLLLV